MAQKDLIIGAFSNYNDYNVLKPWVQSIKDTGFQGDIVLIAVNAGKEIVQTLQTEGVIVKSYQSSGNILIHMLRFLYIYDYLKNNYKEYRYVISTDVRDVIFQHDPFSFLNIIVSAGNPTKIVAVSEAIKIKDEKWNRENIDKNFGEYFRKDIDENPVYNVGLLAGRSDYIKDLCFHLYQMSLNRPDWVADQAAYNILLGFKPWKNIAYECTLAHGWAVNAHVTNKPDQLEEFGPYLLEKRPYMEDGVVKNSFGMPFAIVHQYDRVPEWTEEIHKKYGISITESTNTGTSPKYFTYKT